MICYSNAAVITSQSQTALAAASKNVRLNLGQDTSTVSTNMLSLPQPITSRRAKRALSAFNNAPQDELVSSSRDPFDFAAATPVSLPKAPVPSTATVAAQLQSKSLLVAPPSSQSPGATHSTSVSVRGDVSGNVSPLTGAVKRTPGREALAAAARAAAAWAREQRYLPLYTYTASNNNDNNNNSVRSSLDGYNARTREAAVAATAVLMGSLDKAKTVERRAVQQTWLLQSAGAAAAPSKLLLSPPNINNNNKNNNSNTRSGGAHAKRRKVVSHGVRNSAVNKTPSSHATSVANSSDIVVNKSRHAADAGAVAESAATETVTPECSPRAVAALSLSDYSFIDYNNNNSDVDDGNGSGDDGRYDYYNNSAHVKTCHTRDNNKNNNHNDNNNNVSVDTFSTPEPALTVTVVHRPWYQAHHA